MISLPLLVEAVSVDAVVDTGSQSTIVSKEFLERVDQHLQGQGKSPPSLRVPQIRLYGKSGKQLAIEGEFSLTLSIDLSVVTLPVFVQAGSCHPCLLGMNALPSLGIQLLLGKSSLAGTETHQNNSFVSRVKLVQAVVIPARGAMFVEAELDGPKPIECEGDLVFEPRNAVLERIGLDAPEALVQLQDDGKIWVCLEKIIVSSHAS